MNQERDSKIPEMLHKYEREILADWLEEQRGDITRHSDRIKDIDLHAQSRALVRLFREAAQTGAFTDSTSAHWEKIHDFLDALSRSRADQAFTPSETATFIFSLKQPLFSRLRKDYSRDGDGLAEDYWNATVLLDKLGLYTTEVSQKSREAVIARQQQEMLELSTPVVELWEGILALPLIGTLDSARTQVVMESLLQRIVETGSAIAIIDITGVPTVDTLVAQHLLKTVAA